MILDSPINDGAGSCLLSFFYFFSSSVDTKTAKEFTLELTEDLEPCLLLTVSLIGALPLASCLFETGSETQPFLSLLSGKPLQSLEEISVAVNNI